jgi:hypothetical protein
LPPVIIQTALATPAQAPPAVAPLSASAQQPVASFNAPPKENPPVISRPNASRNDKPSTGAVTAVVSAGPTPTSAGAAKPAERGQSPDRLQPEDLQAAPGLVDDLIRGAASGASPSERRACIRALLRCRVKTPAALAALEGLQNDQTPQVRVDAIIALARLRMMP